jgi:hypothetical protein
MWLMGSAFFFCGGGDCPGFCLGWWAPGVGARAAVPGLYRSAHSEAVWGLDAPNAAERGVRPDLGTRFR